MLSVNLFDLSGFILLNIYLNGQSWHQTEQTGAVKSWEYYSNAVATVQRGLEAKACWLLTCSNCKHLDDECGPTKPHAELNDPLAPLPYENGSLFHPWQPDTSPPRDSWGGFFVCVKTVIQTMILRKSYKCVPWALLRHSVLYDVLICSMHIS